MGYNLTHDHPVIESMERWGVPPWQRPVQKHSWWSLGQKYAATDYEDEDFWEDDCDDVYYGNETEAF